MSSKNLVAPTSQVRLLSVPFEQDYNHVIDFGLAPGHDNISKRMNFFFSLPLININDFMYVRQNQSIKVPFSKETVMKYNYCIYKNSDFSDIWFFAFITHVNYINPNTCEVFLQTDVFQTFYFQCNFKTSFIEREHQDRWTTSGQPIFNLVPESLECGNIVRVIKSIDSYNNNVTNFLVFCNHALQASDSPVVKFILTPINFLYAYFLQQDGMLTFLEEYGRPDSTLSPYVISITPFFGALAQWALGNINQYGLKHIKDITLASKDIAEFNHSPSEFGFIPPPIGTSAGWSHEPKLLTYPYSFYELFSSDGNSSIFQFEYMSSSDSKKYVKAISAISPFQKTVFYISGSYLGLEKNPQSFAESNSNYDIGLTSSAWSNYMASNKASFTVGTFNSLAQGMVGNFSALAMGNPFSLVSNTASILSTISSVTAKIQDLRSSPASYSGGASDLYIDLTSGYLLPKVFLKQIDTQFLEICGDYFMKFGYKCNRVKIPNTLSRHRFNYLKTINCEFTGDIPQDDLSTLKSIFDSGVTLWHDPSFFLDYSIDNTEQNRF